MTRHLAVFALCLASAACSRPLLVVDETAPLADVDFVNTSGGFLQQFFFDDPVSCDGVKLIDYSVQPRETKSHRIPAGKLITIWTSGFGLPAAPGSVAWCRPAAFTTRLEPGQHYRLSFFADTDKMLCGTTLTLASGDAVVRVERRVSGPEIAGGGMLSGSMSCNAGDDLGVFKQ